MVVEARPPMGSRSTVRHRNALFKAGVGSQETLAGRPRARGKMNS